MNPFLSYLNEAIEQLTKAGIETPRLDAEVLLAHALGCERHELYTGNVIPTKVGIQSLQKLDSGLRRNDEFDALIARRLKNEPIAYIIGYKEFWSMKLKVTPAVLVPRPATEKLVEKALELLSEMPPSPSPLPLREGVRGRGKSILDLGTGSGAISAALAKELPAAKIVATDISEEALNVARENLKFAEDRVILIRSNLFENVTGKFDLIISNPPYIPSEIVLNLDPDVTDYEPHLALDGGEDGLDFIDKIRQDAPNFLKEEGWLILENGASGLKVETWNVLSLKEGSPSMALSL